MIIPSPAPQIKPLDSGTNSMKTMPLFALAVSLLPLTALNAAEPPSIEALVGGLKSERAESRARAAESLGELGPLAASAVPALVTALSDKNVEVQYEALLALEHIGPAARGAVPELIAILKGSNRKLHSGAAGALGSIGHDAEPAVPDLLPLLKGEGEHVAAAAGLALARILPPDSGELRKALPALVQSLKSGNAEARSDAVIALSLCGPAAVPALSDLVKAHNGSPQHAASAAAALGFMGPEAKAAVPVLEGALGSRNEKVVASAADALGAIGGDSKSAIPQLRKLLAGSQPLIRAHAARALGAIGPASEPAVGDLAKALTDAHEDVRREAADALGRIGPGSKSALPALVTALNDESGAVTLHAAGAIGRIGPEAAQYLVPLVEDRRHRDLAVMILADLGPAAKDATSVLASTLASYDGELSEHDRDLCREIALTLAHIGPGAKAATPALMKILANEKHPLRAGAAWALAKIGAKEAIPLLETALDSNDNPRLHVVAPSALMLLDPGNETYVRLAVPRLTDALGDKSPLVRREVAATLGSLGPKAASAVPKLAETLADPDPAIRSEVLAALGAIGPESAKAVPAILPQLAALEVPVRCSASYAVGSIGPTAKEAIPLLEKNLQERDDFLEMASAWALVRIDPKREGLAAKCLGPLTKALKVPDARARNEAVISLAMMGRAAQPARAALQALARDPDETVRKSVTEALKAIGN
jgi:HEAT repeat protein